jgi:hypothetical protein
MTQQVCTTHLKKTYEAFCDYVLKNPFLDIEMPIRCKVFDSKIRKIYSPYTQNIPDPALQEENTWR